MHVLLRAATALAAAALSLAAAAADAPAPAAAASAPATPCVAPGADRAADDACAMALARQADSEAKAGHDDAALAAFARADQFAPNDLRYLMARANLALKAAKQRTPAGIDAAARAAPDDIGLSLMHAELSFTRKDYATGLADLDRVIAKRPDATLAWEMRAAADVARPDFAAARIDLDHALELDPKSAPSLRLRSVVRNNAGDHAGALADDEAARALAPHPDDPFVIGSTQFLLRRYADAAETMARRAPPAPDGAYWTLWRYMALARLNGIERASGALGPGASPGQAVAWPVPVIDFFHGTVDAKALLDFAKKSQDVHDLSQVCEAHFYMAEDALLRRSGDPVGLFRLAVKECPQNFHEYEGAVAELRAAGVPLVAPGAMAATPAGAAAIAAHAAPAVPTAPVAPASSASSASTAP